jgi:hypothetical protein
VLGGIWKVINVDEKEERAKYAALRNTNVDG